MVYSEIFGVAVKNGWAEKSIESLLDAIKDIDEV